MKIGRILVPRQTDGKERSDLVQKVQVHQTGSRRDLRNRHEAHAKRRLQVLPTFAQMRCFLQHGPERMPR